MKTRLVLALSLCCLSLPSFASYSPPFTVTAPTNATTSIVRKGTIAETQSYKASQLMTILGNDTCSVRQVDVGADELGGGYIGYVKIYRRDGTNSSNVVAYRYGRGWQSSIRDDLHMGRHNPTQAGFNDLAGAGARLTRVLNGTTVTGLNIGKFAVPLFSNAEFDFTRFEDLAPDDFPNDNGNSDADTFAEASWGASGQDLEVRSEFEFEGRYDNISSMITSAVRIPALRHRYYYALTKPPKSIQQFAGVIGNDVNPSLDPESYMQKLTALANFSGLNAVPTKYDYSGGMLSYGIRIFKQSNFGYKFALFPNGTGGWTDVGLDLTPGGARNSAKVHTHVDLESGVTQFGISTTGHNFKNTAGNTQDMSDTTGLMVMSTAATGTSGTAIGLYVPRNTTNTALVAGFDAAGARIYTENRRVASSWIPSYNPSANGIGDQMNIVYRTFFSGLFSPSSAALQATNPRATVEAIYQDVVILFGTPDEILAAVKDLQATNALAD